MLADFAGIGDDEEPETAKQDKHEKFRELVAQWKDKHAKLHMERFGPYSDLKEQRFWNGALSMLNGCWLDLEEIIRERDAD